MATKFCVNKFVEVALVIVPLVDDRFVFVIFVAERFVIVALVSVAFPAKISAFVRLLVPVAFKLVVLIVAS